MRTLIIPDIHTNFGLAEYIIEKENADEIVFLGDYFDNWDDGIELATQTAEWLKESMTKPNRIHLLGNHDNSYRDPKHMCSGYLPIKKAAIDRIGINWKEIRLHVWVGDWLCTHAGLSNEFFVAYDGIDVNQFLNEFEDDKDLRETLYSVSGFRGGRDPNSGILWCDWREFEPIPGVKQIMGHTVDDDVRNNGDNYCIDTILHHYAIYDHTISKMTIKEVEE